MDKRLRITGIYDRKTMKTLSALGVTSMGFDFRPKSFSFLQEYVLLDMLETSYRPTHQYFLEFQNEADFVINKLLEDINAAVGKHGHTIKENFYLEFSDELERSYYDAFGLPFVWHFKGFDHLEKLVSSPNFHGVVLDYPLLQGLHNGEELVPFVNEINKVCGSSSFILNQDWDSDIFPTLFEYFSFANLSLAINQKTELSYRNVDTVAVKRHLQQYL